MVSSCSKCLTYLQGRIDESHFVLIFSICHSRKNLQTIKPIIVWGMGYRMSLISMTKWLIEMLSKWLTNQCEMECEMFVV